MKPKTVMLLAVAVGSGLLAMLGVQQAMTGNQGQTEETVQVLVALTDIDVGEELTEEIVEFREMAVSAVPQDAVTKAEQYEKRSLNFAISQDDVIRLGKLSKPGVIGKSTQITTGMRAYPIPVDETMTIGGLISAGDRVDVLVNYTSRDKNGRQVSKSMTLLEYVEVFSTDDRTARESRDTSDAKSKTRVVALLLTPEQVNYVALAKAKGKLELAWRHRGDDVVANANSVNLEALDELKGMPDAGDHPWMNREDPTLYAETGLTANPPETDTDEVPPPEPNVADLLHENEQAQPVVVAVEPIKPKPTWNVQIYVGNQAQTAEFELPEPPQPEPSTTVPSGDNGGQLWDLLKQAI